jgi:hypothetical protein
MSVREKPKEEKLFAEQIFDPGFKDKKENLLFNTISIIGSIAKQLNHQKVSFPSSSFSFLSSYFLFYFIFFFFKGDGAAVVASAGLYSLSSAISRCPHH